MIHKSRGNRSGFGVREAKRVVFEKATAVEYKTTGRQEKLADVVGSYRTRGNRLDYVIRKHRESSSNCSEECSGRLEKEDEKNSNTSWGCRGDWDDIEPFRSHGGSVIARIVQIHQGRQTMTGNLVNCWFAGSASKPEAGLRRPSETGLGLGRESVLAGLTAQSSILAFGSHGPTSSASIVGNARPGLRIRRDLRPSELHPHLSNFVRAFATASTYVLHPLFEIGNSMSTQPVQKISVLPNWPLTVLARHLRKLRQHNSPSDSYFDRLPQPVLEACLVPAPTVNASESPVPFMLLLPGSITLYRAILYSHLFFPLPHLVPLPSTLPSTVPPTRVYVVYQHRSVAGVVPLQQDQCCRTLDFPIQVLMHFPNSDGSPSTYCTRTMASSSGVSHDNDDHAGDHDGNLNDSEATVTTPTTTMRATPMSSPEDRNLSDEGPNDDNSNDNSPDDDCNNDGGGGDDMGQRTR
ncbi:hypothetical protein EDB87DRAFT_1574763 [Lactarius vividus]|nr:hypothetical protein EDB87DRAFT_1574763 [Lactarius vividus]